FAAAGEKKRELSNDVPAGLFIEGTGLSAGFGEFKLAIPGVLTLKAPSYVDGVYTGKEISQLNSSLKAEKLKGIALIVLCDDAAFTAANINNLVWVTFTRSNPATDIHGIDAFIQDKHWGCKGPLIIDARKKPHHAPELVKDQAVENKVDQLGLPGGPLHGII
ncbi:MAG TPA: hypothetical protein VK541_05295, partial [Pedobacter sp.]|nr:hypothetical protein [Pedobacter sp.]